MKTLTPTEARDNLTKLCRRCVHGEEIGLIWNGHVIALRQVPIFAGDYPMAEYGASAEEMSRFAKRADEEIAQDRRTRPTRRYTGKLKNMVRGGREKVRGRSRQAA